MLAPFFASFAYVALRAFQQLNVQHHKIGWAVPISYGMAYFDMFLIGTIAINAVNLEDKVWLWFQLGTGGALGAIFSMLLHKKFRKDK
ncbi:MAG: hypothetical protein KAS66_05385 [Candidatus Omnitrophica bacterium]|nr:hypothetical protein [Candidatus Omnitrophota bacterium]